MTPHAREARQDRALIVGDVAGLRCRLTALVESEGFAVVVCGTVEEALACMARERFAILIADLPPSEPNSVRFLDRIRALNTTSRIILHTASASGASTKDAITFNIGASIESGGNPAEFVQVLHRAHAEYLRRYAAELEVQVAQQTLALSQSETRYQALFDRAMESERFVRATLDALLEHLCVLDETGTILTVNNAWREYAAKNSSGPVHTAEGANYLSVCDATTGEFAEQARTFAAGIRAVINGERESFLYEYHCPSPTYPGWFRGRVTKFAGEGPVRVVVAHEDITEQKNAEAALRESEELFRTLAETSQAGIGIIQGDTVVYCNPAVAPMTGYTREELLEMPFWSAFAGESRTEIQEAQHTGLSAGVPSHLELEICTKTGEQRWLHFSFATLTYRGQSAGLGVAIDITERRRMEEELRASESRFRATFEQAAVGMAHVGLDGRFFLVNQKLCDILGYSCDELQQRFCPDLTHPDDRALVESHLLRVLEGHVSYFVLEKRNIRKDQSLVWIRLTSTLVREADGTPLYFVDVIEDISEQKKAAEALQSLSHRVLNAQEQERRHLARELHDELGQVLSALKMTLQNGQRRPTNLALRVEESVAMVQTALEQVRTLSRNLRPPMLDELGLVAALRWYVKQQSQRMEVEIAFVAEVPEQRFPLEVETACFRVAQEALTNIMRHAQARHVWVDLRYHDGKLHLLVQDDGVGFEMETVSARTAQGASSGLLGMRERIQLVGGQVQVTSVCGVGTEIRAVFPTEPDTTFANV